MGQVNMPSFGTVLKLPPNVFKEDKYASNTTHAYIEPFGIYMAIVSKAGYHANDLYSNLGYCIVENGKIVDRQDIGDFSIKYTITPMTSGSMKGKLDLQITHGIISNLQDSNCIAYAIKIAD